MASYFVVVVDTRPSGHLAELADLLFMRFRPTIILRQSSSPSSAFLEDRILDDSKFRVAQIAEIKPETIAEHVRWAKSEAEKQIDSYNTANKWRNTS